jgi:hypothetical protein
MHMLRGSRLLALDNEKALDAIDCLLGSDKSPSRVRPAKAHAEGSCCILAKAWSTFGKRIGACPGDGIIDSGRPGQADGTLSNLRIQTIH